MEKLSLSLLAIESDVPVTWKPGRAAMDLVETSRALDVFVSGIRLDSDVIDTVTEVCLHVRYSWMFVRCVR